MGGDVIPPLSDCVQLSVEQYRTKLYDIIRQEKAARYVQMREKWLAHALKLSSNFTIYITL